MENPFWKEWTPEDRAAFQAIKDAHGRQIAAWRMAAEEADRDPEAQKKRFAETDLFQGGTPEERIAAWADALKRLIEETHAKGNAIFHAYREKYRAACAKDRAKVIRDAGEVIAAYRADKAALERERQMMNYPPAVKTWNIAPGAALEPIAALDIALRPQRDAATYIGGSLLEEIDALELELLDALGYPKPKNLERRLAIWSPLDTALRETTGRGVETSPFKTFGPNGEETLTGKVGFKANKPFPLIPAQTQSGKAIIDPATIQTIRGILADPSSFKGKIRQTPISLSALKLHRYAAELWAKASDPNAEICFPLEEFADACDRLDASPDALRKWSASITHDLSGLRLILDGGRAGRIYLPFFDACGFANGLFTIKYRPQIVKAAFAKPLLTWHSPGFYQIPADTHSAAGLILAEMDYLASQSGNRIRGTAGSASVSVLHTASRIARKTDLGANANHWRDRILDTFEGELDYLADGHKFLPNRRPPVAEWHYTKARSSEPIAREAVRAMSYEEWRRLMVRYTLSAPFPKGEAERLEAEKARREKEREERIAAAKKAAKKKGRKAGKPQETAPETLADTYEKEPPRPAYYRAKGTDGIKASGAVLGGLAADLIGGAQKAPEERPQATPEPIKAENLYPHGAPLRKPSGSDLENAVRGLEETYRDGLEALEGMEGGRADALDAWEWKFREDLSPEEIAAGIAAGKPKPWTKGAEAMLEDLRANVAAWEEKLRAKGKLTPPEGEELPY